MTTLAETKGEVAPWVERSARLGYATKGLVYVLVGGLALRAAFGLGGRTTDSSGALLSILQQPFGRVLLLLVALGLAAYMLWRLAQGTFDLERKGRDAKGVLKRLGYALSGLAYGSLAFTALQLALGRGGGGDDGSELWTARLLGLPFGRVLVGLVALAAFGIALNAVYVAATGMFKKKLRLAEMDERTEHAASVIGRVGLVARSIVLGIIGWFFLQAALRSSAEEAGDSAEALGVLERGPYGAWLLAAVALGLVCYGVYAFFQARYRKVEV